MTSKGWGYLSIPIPINPNSVVSLVIRRIPCPGHWRPFTQVLFSPDNHSFHLLFRWTTRKAWLFIDSVVTSWARNGMRTTTSARGLQGSSRGWLKYFTKRCKLWSPQILQVMVGYGWCVDETRNCGNITRFHPSKNSIHKANRSVNIFGINFQLKYPWGVIKTNYTDNVAAPEYFRQNGVFWNLQKHVHN